MVRSFDQEKDSGDRKGNIIFICIGIAIILGISLLIYKVLTDVDLGENNCPLIDNSEHPRGEYVVLFDKTDRDKDSLLITMDIKQELSRIKDMIPKYARLSIYLITDDLVENYKPIKKPICNPGSLEDRNWFVRSGIIGVPVDIRREFSDDFSNIVDQNFIDILNSSNSDFSPIFEMIQAVNVLNFKNSNQDYENRLFIFSDMLHNMPGKYTHYQMNQNYNFFKEKHLSYYSKIKTNLNNVVVEINLIPRNKDKIYQGETLKNFWYNFFEDMKAEWSYYNNIGS